MAQSSTAKSWARGGSVFAATIMLIVGIFQFFEGIAAIASNNFFLVMPNYTYQINTTAWGWIHLVIGALAAMAGLFIYTGATWARVIGIVLAVVSATANFFFMPYYPMWSLLIIAVDIFVIWALASVRLSDMSDVPAGYDTRAYSGTPESGQRWPSNPAEGSGMVTDTKPGMRSGMPQPEPGASTSTRSGGEQGGQSKPQQ